jgi:hypothetical protein
MTPVFQSILTAPGGDCFRACVASIFELPLEVVPHFLGDAAGDANWTDAQWRGLVEFAQGRGYMPWWIDPENDPHGDAAEQVRDLERRGGHYVATVRPYEETELGHCVVMQGGRLVHDPMPGGSGAEGVAPVLYICFIDLADSGRML